MKRLELIGVSKSFARNKANDNISLDVGVGEVHAIVGENGAGKSTLMSMVCGLLQPDEGALVWEGKECTMLSPLDARKRGVGIVMQHFSLFEGLSVGENLYLHASLSRKISLAELEQEAERCAAKFDFDLNWQARVGDLSVGERQRIEILRCLLQEHLKLLILDEPTAVLTQQEADALLTILRQLANDGCSILYISHKLREINELADRATILRQGRVVTTINPQDENAPDIAALMMGENAGELENDFESNRSLDGRDSTQHSDSLSPESEPLNNEVQLSKAHLSFDHIDLMPGQILGIAGVAGNGQNELLNLLSGETREPDEKIYLNDKDISSLSLAQRYALGVASAPAERLERAVSLSHSLIENFYLKARLLDKKQVINWRACTQAVQSIINDFDVKCSGADALASTLSGGNLQKFIIGRELYFKPKVLICHQPTWGVDIHAANFIHSKLRELAANGASVILLSEDLDELLERCDALAVINSGVLSGVKAVGAWSVTEVGQHMSATINNGQFSFNADEAA